jgi:hypothetical protein
MGGSIRGLKALAIAIVLGFSLAWVFGGEAGAQEFEAGLLDVTQVASGDWHRIQFDREFAAPPVVVLGPLSANNSQGATLRVRNVTTSDFEFQIDEWDYLDGAHPSEQLSFLALAEGRHSIAGLQWEAQRVAGVDRAGVPVTLQNSYSTAPLVLTQIEGEANPHSLSARIRNLGASGFDAFLQSEEANAALVLEGEALGVIAIEIGSGVLGDLAFEVGLAPALVGRAWSPCAFQQQAPHPVLLAGIQSENAADPAVLRLRALSPAGVEFRCDEEQSADTERSHRGEQIAYLAIAGEVVQGSGADAKIEFGYVTAAQSPLLGWQSVSFAQTYERPVVVTGPLTNNNGAPAGVRLRNVTGVGFEFKIEEWDYLAPGRHPEETFSFIVMEDGLYEIDGVRIEAGRVEHTATSDSTRYFTQGFRGQPILLPQLASDLAPEAATARVTGVNGSNFSLRISEEESADGIHPDEQVHYLAVEPGSGRFSNGIAFAAIRGARRLGGGWRHFDFGANFLSPFVFAAAQSGREPDPFHLRIRNLSGFGTGLRLREEASLDRELSHVREDLGILVLQGGTDSDGDGLPDGWEIAHGLDPGDPGDAAIDIDGDGLSALQEFQFLADPHRADSDGDGLLDAFEALAGTLTNRNARAPYKPKPKTGLTVFTPEPRPFDPAP